MGRPSKNRWMAIKHTHALHYKRLVLLDWVQVCVQNMHGQDTQGQAEVSELNEQAVTLIRACICAAIVMCELGKYDRPLKLALAKRMGV